jgi:hypothetical protein
MEKAGAGSEGSFLGKMKALFGLAKVKEVAQPSSIEDTTGAPLRCCSDRVHIAYRGVSDERLYLAENRTINELKFFRPLGLRVFCAECRKRLS